MASPGNRRCASRIGALLFPVNEYFLTAHRTNWSTSAIPIQRSLQNKQRCAIVNSNANIYGVA